MLELSQVTDEEELISIDQMFNCWLLGSGPIIAQGVFIQGYAQPVMNW